MAIQITYSRIGEASANALRRKDAMRFDALPVTIGGETGRQMGIDKPSLALSETPEHLHVVTPKAGAEVLLNGICVTNPTRIKSGDCLQVGQTLLHVYSILPPVPRSWQAKTMAIAAKGLLWGIIFLELLTIFWLPTAFSGSSVWDGAMARQQISIDLDETRSRLLKLRQQPGGGSSIRQPLIRLLAAEIALDLDQRAQYLQQYDIRMTRSQRKKMTQNLEQINGLIDKIENGLTFPDIPEPELEKAIRTLLDEKTEK